MRDDQLIYNIPIDLADVYSGRHVIVRVGDPAKLIEKLPEPDPDLVHYVTIASAASDTDILANWAPGIPMDMELADPIGEASDLYHYAKLLDKHPVRITIPVGPGFAKAVRIATSLSFAVKIVAGQPGTDELAEMSDILEMFLHRTAFSSPVEFYQGSLEAFFIGSPATLWQVQEEDPSRFRYINPDGAETLPPRVRGEAGVSGSDPAAFLEKFTNDLIQDRTECQTCDYWLHCRGYFKWPDTAYVCAGGIKELFREIKTAAGELKSDLAAYSVAKQGAKP